ncbi:MULTISPECIES: hypothetical protein [unclassified Leptospira]|nr:MULTISPECIES: hypothetical protein [unclassified Leptospira]EMJ98755.1 hypothetical protein LEP1GSC192_0600 [Leptospira sp. B5-022]
MHLSSLRWDHSVIVVEPLKEFVTRKERTKLDEEQRECYLD